MVRRQKLFFSMLNRITKLIIPLRNRRSQDYPRSMKHTMAHFFSLTNLLSVLFLFNSSRQSTIKCNIYLYVCICVHVTSIATLIAISLVNLLKEIRYFNIVDELTHV